MFYKGKQRFEYDEQLIIYAKIMPVVLSVLINVENLNTKLHSSQEQLDTKRDLRC